MLTFMRARFERILSSDFSLIPAISRCHSYHGKPNGSVNLSGAHHTLSLCTLAAAAVAGTPQGQRCAVLPLVAVHHSRLLVWLTQRPGQGDVRRAASGLSTRFPCVLSKYKGEKYVFVLVYYYFLKNLKAG
jgi:hypothetical protein